MLHINYIALAIDPFLGPLWRTNVLLGSSAQLSLQSANLFLRLLPRGSECGELLRGTECGFLCASRLSIGSSYSAQEGINSKSNTSNIIP